MHAASRFALNLVLCCLPLAAAQTGRLEPGDDSLDSGEYFDVHLLEGVAGEQLDLSLASDDFDPYLIVLAPDGSALFQEDDTPGQGLGVRTVLGLPATGTYTLVATSAFADETGEYTLTVNRLTSAAPVTLPGVPLTPAAPGNPLARQALTNPLSPAAPFAGTFAGEGMVLSLEVAGTGITGSLTVDGVSYTVEGTIAGDTFSGTFGAASQRFELSATLQTGASGSRQLLLESGGASYLLAASSAAPAAPGVAAPAQAPEPTGPVMAAGPRSDAPRPRGDLVRGVGPRAGHVTGTVFDTLGRPLAGAGVLITGTTYVQGQRTSFDTVTGADGTYAVRVPDGRYGARAWVDVQFNGVTYSRILHPLSGNANSQIDSEVGGTLDFQWLLSGLSAPPGNVASNYYGATIDLTYCGLPADAYCASEYAAFPDRPVPGGSTVRVTLTPVGPLIDGTEGEELNFQFTARDQDPDYPYGGAPNAPAGFEEGGAGRLTLGSDWEYHSTYLYDIPLGIYDVSAIAILPDGSFQPFRLGLDADDVEHASVRVTFSSWDGFSGRAYSGGGLHEVEVHIRD